MLTINWRASTKKNHVVIIFSAHHVISPFSKMTTQEYNVIIKTFDYSWVPNKRGGVRRV